MKRVGQVLLCLMAAALFGYLMFWDYPSMQQELTPGESSEEVEELPDESASPESSAAEVSTEPVNETEVLDADALREQLPATQALVFTGSIRQTVYDTVYPVLDAANAAGTLLFFDGHLTGDYDQMSTAEFQELVDDGWSYAIGGLDDTLSGEEWESSLMSEIYDIGLRAGVRPVVYCFQAGEYQPERAEILEEEGFTAFYYAAEDASAVQEDTTDLKRICWISFADQDEEELSDLLDQAWSCDSVAFALELDQDSSSTASQWETLLSALEADDRFEVTSQSDWLESERESTENRAEMVASVLEAEKE